MDKNSDPIERLLDLVCETGMTSRDRNICLGCLAIIAGLFLGVVGGFVLATPHMLYTLWNLPTPPR
jgi:hypothetical protein